MGVWLAALLAVAAALSMPAGAAEKFRPFKLKSVDGGERKLADVLGKATLVVFFFPTCAYCKVSLPEVQRLQDTYKEHGLTAVWINVLPQEDRLIPDWRARNGFTAPILLGGRSAQHDYELTMTPTHYLLDAGGRALFKQAGYTRGDEKVLEQRIRQALALSP
jgi:peroxiredoxin